MAMIRNEKIAKHHNLMKKGEIENCDTTESRIITKNLVYVIGLSSRIATKEILIKKEYFGQYGNIIKIIVNNNKAYNQNSSKGPSYSAYVTYSKPYEASIAILSLDNVLVDNHLIRASFGTTKYCSYFLKKIECTNKDCLFLHRIADKSDIISREELNGNKNIFLEQQLYAMKIADIFNPEIKKKIQACAKKIKSIMPAPDSIYNKELIKTNDPVYQKNKIAKKNYFEDSNTNNDFKESKINNISTQKQNDHPNLAETSSTSSKEDIHYINSASEEKINNNKSENITEIQHKLNNTHRLFENRKSSRFEFANKIQSNKEDFIESVEIPEFVKLLIKKKVSTFVLTKNMKHMEDLLYSDKNLESEYKNRNIWAEFIINNKSDDNYNEESYDKEFIEDFDYINNLVLNKYHINN